MFYFIFKHAKKNNITVDLQRLKISLSFDDYLKKIMDNNICHWKCNYFKLIHFGNSHITNKQNEFPIKLDFKTI